MIKGCEKNYKGAVTPKAKFRTIRDAEEILNRHHPHDARMGIYECDNCGWYHLGHWPLQNGSERRKRAHEEAVVGILIGVLKHVINGDPLPQTNAARKLHLV